MSNMQIIIQLIISFLLAIAVSLYATRIVVHVVNKLNLFDRPNERSSAEKPVPTLGGIAIFFSFIFASSLGMSGYGFPEMIYILTALLLIFFVGLKDDIVTLSPYKKLTAQIAAASILILLGDIRFTNLHGLFGIGGIGMIPSFLITTFTMVVIINAFNLMDGIDGLASGLSMMAALIFGGWFFISGHFGYAILSFSLVGALAGFFYYNVYGKQYKIFMGDTGSLVLGTIMSILVIRFNELNIDQAQPYAIESVPAISFAILAYPLFDTIRVMAIRMVHHQSPFRADKNHLHHRLLALGFSHRAATYTIIGTNVAFICLIYAMHNLGILRISFYMFMLGSLLFVIPAYFLKKNKLINADDPVQQLLIPEFTDEKKKRRRYVSRTKKEVPDLQSLRHQSFFQKFNLW